MILEKTVENPNSDSSLRNHRAEREDYTSADRCLLLALLQSEWVKTRRREQFRGCFSGLFSFSARPEFAMISPGAKTTGSSSLFTMSAPMAGVDFRLVRSAISMAEVLALLEFQSVRSGGNQVRGPCPLHGSASERSRSFSANLAKNTFQCFQCRAAGNQLDLWAAVTKQNLYQAAIDLCTKLNREVPWLQKPDQRRGTRI